MYISKGEKYMATSTTPASTHNGYQIHTCRFDAWSHKDSRAHREAGDQLKLFLVPLRYWAYANDRLGARGDAQRATYYLRIRAYTAKQASSLARREANQYDGVSCGTPELMS
jgi:hypothetical protein